MKKQDYAEAIQYYQESLEISEDGMDDVKSVIYVNLCWALYKTGENDEASKLVDKALKLVSHKENPHEILLIRSIKQHMKVMMRKRFKLCFRHLKKSSCLFS